MNELSPLSSLTPPNGSDPSTIRRVAIEFESLFLSQILKTAQPKLSQTLLGGGMAEEFFQDTLSEERARAMAQNGGMGLAKILEAELTPRTHLKKDLISSDNMDVNQVVQQRAGLKVYEEGNTKT